MKKWVALFSQTGSEVVDLALHFDRWPDIIITNNKGGNIHPLIKSRITHTVTESEARSLNILDDAATRYDLVTLHGWLKIVPEDKCIKYDIYNGHPGLITKYPELKGKDPQKKAVKLKHVTAGCVIHQATAELDGGPIVAESREVSINGWYEDEEWVIQKLHKVSVDLWVEFLKDKLA